MLKTPRVTKILTLVLLLLFVISVTGCKETQPTEKTEKATVVEWSKNLNIYEANIRQFTEEGTFKAFQEHLPKLKELGVGVIWFMPIHPIGEEGRKGTLGSYYAVKDYKAVNPEFGTIEEFQNLVKKAHDLGMFVIIDWVANHTSWDNIWTKTNPDFYSRDSTGNFYPPVADWADVIDLNYDNKQLWPAMIDALKFWVEECDIDGYRCDVAAMVPLEFWQQARAELDKIKPVFMLAEAHEAELHDNAFDMTYDWEFLHTMNQVSKGEMSAADVAAHFEQNKDKYQSEDYNLLFTTNHDENSWNGTAFERLGEGGAEAFTVICATAKGMHLIYSGQEAGLNKSLEFFEKDLIDWKDHPHRDLYANLSQLKKNNKALWNGIHGGEMKILQTDKNDQLFAFARENEGNTVIVVANLSNERCEGIVTDSVFTGVFDYFLQDLKIPVEGSLNVALRPWKWIVLMKNEE